MILDLGNMYSKKLTDTTINTLVGSYINLRKLDLSNCKQITDIGIRQITQCRNLEHLALNFLEFLIDETICIIVQSYPNISYFNLEFCHVTDTAIGVVFINFRPVIQDLELGFCELITDIAIKNITHNLFNLKYLGLKYCIDISKEALDMLNLDLDISGIRHFLTASILCICITSISKLDVEELPESLSEVFESEVPKSEVAEIFDLRCSEEIDTSQMKKNKTVLS
ncbi:hypothetical protein Glove_63g105 [Diversispora epigaea]|uniref:F-box/LRR-repeat protein 15-like leucin rich repeat domain-containing protein n=1 Tax=Diversispora epigaea TaxID=1348612 RepID=A0A397JI90_9GLOM|nr:hypothetical protein Glove_63g105 [Diversispora epigaea]